jgi:hypothetical protein
MSGLLSIKRTYIGAIDVATNVQNADNRTYSKVDLYSQSSFPGLSEHGQLLPVNIGTDARVALNVCAMFRALLHVSSR